MGQRSTRTMVLTTFLLVLLVAAPLFAQVYPKQETLDVITLSDRTILKGVITETVPDRYVEIEVYGGSVFVLGFAQIESITEQPNPDYAPTWIKVDLAAIRAGEEPAADAEADARARGDLPSLRDGGVVLGAYVMTGGGWYGGSDWDDALPENSDEQFIGTLGLGLFVRATGQPEAFSGSRWMLGFRGGVGYAERYGGFFTDDPFGTGDLKYEEITNTIVLPMEILIGSASERFALYGGLGPGVSVLLLDPRYEVSFEGTGEFDEEGTYDTDIGVSIIATTSLNAVLSLGRSWEADLRVAYERLLIPWNSDREVYHNAIDITLGVGYRF